MSRTAKRSYRFAGKSAPSFYGTESHDLPPDVIHLGQYGLRVAP